MSQYDPDHMATMRMAMLRPKRRKSSISQKSEDPPSKTGGTMTQPCFSKSQSKNFKWVGRNYRKELVQGDSQDGGLATKKCQ
jgi:hypothetical protein